MERLSLKEIIQAVDGRCVQSYEGIEISQISTDSRKLEKGDLYIALVGESFDGHDFIEEVISKGTAAVIASKPMNGLFIPILEVEDTLKALWQLATYYRQKLCKPVIAVTGSVGKTSTKDMIATILSRRYQVHKSKGNFNNHIGLPLTLLEMEDRHELAVVEMGMRGFGEISALTHIAQPNIAAITNIGLSHIERLGSQENILKAKLEIVEGLPKNGLLILNMDDPYLAQVTPMAHKRMVTIGIEMPADYQAYSVNELGEEGISFKIKLNEEIYEVKVPAIGKHNVYNVLIGIACGLELGMLPEEILEGIQEYQPEKMRLNLLEIKGIKFINDCYNASPDSMQAALQVLAGIAKGGRAIAILGNMFELGHMASTAHYEVGKMCERNAIDFAALLGENAIDMARGIGVPSKFKIFETHEEIVAYMKDTLRTGDVVLLKGSRGMKMERILELYTSD